MTMRYERNLHEIAQIVYLEDAARILGIRPAVLTALATGEVIITSEKSPVAKRIHELATFLRSDFYRDIETLAEYLSFADVAKLLSVTPAKLRGVMEMRSTLPLSAIKAVHGRAVKIRRRQGQQARLSREQADRESRRDVRARLTAIGMPDVALPKKLPPFLRYHERGRLDSPVYIYDVRHVQDYPDITAFFRFMKTVLPSGYFFLTYQVLPGGTSPQGGVNYYVHQYLYLSTPYIPFCRAIGKDVPAGNCILMTDDEFYDNWRDVGDVSAGRKVVEVGISHTRPPASRPYLELSEAELAEDQAMGRDYVAGMKIIRRD